MSTVLCLHLSHSILHRSANSLLSKSSSIFHSCYASTDSRQLRSTDQVALEYADLNLPYKDSGELGPVRVRQHVNPLSSSNINGCEPSQEHPYNRLRTVLQDAGVELVKRAELWMKELAITNIHFMHANASVSFKQLASTYLGPFVLVSILCPDPHFKKRHHKRRVVQTPLVDSIVKRLMHGGKVFIHSDVLEVALDMRNWFDAELDVLQHIDTVDFSVPCDEERWLLSNPMGIRTEREIHAEFEVTKIYRDVIEGWRGVSPSIGYRVGRLIKFWPK